MSLRPLRAGLVAEARRAALVRILPLSPLQLPAADVGYRALQNGRPVESALVRDLYGTVIRGRLPPAIKLTSTTPRPQRSSAEPWELALQCIAPPPERPQHLNAGKHRLATETSVATHLKLRRGNPRERQELEGKTMIEPGDSRCAHCGAEFRRRRPWQKFCTKTCRWHHWNEQHPRVSRTSAAESDGLRQ